MAEEYPPAEPYQSGMLDACEGNLVYRHVRHLDTRRRRAARSLAADALAARRPDHRDRPAVPAETGTAAEWEAWAGMAMPSAGDYILPGGLEPLPLDRGTGEGVHIEPGIWVQHQ